MSLLLCINPCASYSAVMQVQLKAPDSDGSSSCCLQSFLPSPQPLRTLYTHIWHHFQLHSVWLCIESCSEIQCCITPTRSRHGNVNWGSSKGSVWLEAGSVIPVASPLWGTLWGKDRALGAQWRTALKDFASASGAASLELLLVYGYFSLMLLRGQRFATAWSCHPHHAATGLQK